MSAVVATDSGESLPQVAALDEPFGGNIDYRTPEAVSCRESLGINIFQFTIIGMDDLRMKLVSQACLGENGIMDIFMIYMTQQTGGFQIQSLIRLILCHLGGAWITDMVPYCQAVVW